jgi:nitrite reductase/ring-hydroxylating ferredoxin subunit/DMSO/TMAO reductase YedYZ heme-binding membrane subunit
MSSGHSYKAVGWNRQKKVYDSVLIAGVVLYLGAFISVGALLRPNATIETLLIRALGTGAFFLLHVVLSIGPLCRLDPRFLPLLYNRRHLGVTLFILALAHGAFSIFQFHALGDTNPLVSVLISNGRYNSLAAFPFQPLGLLALLILFLMAATSHDFWLANLSVATWKRLHMLVYLAYALLVVHVAAGALQVEPSPVLAALLGLGMVWLLTLHLLAGWRERKMDRDLSSSRTDEPFIDACALADIPDGRARVVSLGDERVAIFRYDHKLSALSNVCQHQNGPLGEGRVVKGCVVCPWHGYEYRPETGASPPPFTEKVSTFRLRLQGARILIDPTPRAPGTHTEPLSLSPAETRES